VLAKEIVKLATLEFVLAIALFKLLTLASVLPKEVVKLATLLFVLATTFLKVQAQTTFEQNFLGEEFFLYKGVLLKLIDNPKQPGKASWERYNKYQLAGTLRELIELSATSNNPAERQRQIQKAHADIANDAIRGYILFPQHEHNVSAHFVDAANERVHA
jgi:hypothetical protein